MDGKGSNGSGSRPGSPSINVADVPMTEEEVANNITLSNLKSNQVGQRELFLDSNVNENMSEQ